MRAQDVIVKPILTEKSYAGIQGKVYTFRVSPNANKVQIRKAVEELFKVHVTDVNMTAAYSRIMDVDMAEEMTEYTKNQVLVQSSTSMLAQANERPSQVLQLLQQEGGYDQFLDTVIKYFITVLFYKVGNTIDKLIAGYDKGKNTIDNDEKLEVN